MDIISRMKLYMEHCRMSSSQFADSAGIPRPTLSQLLNGRNKSSEGAKKVSSDIIRKIHDAFPHLNVMWLLFGDGDMEIDANTQFSEAQNEVNSLHAPDQTAENQSNSKQTLFDDDFPEFDINRIETPIEQKKQPDIHTTPIEGQPSAAYTPSPTVSLKPDTTKRVQSIMVFYSDNSFEIFKPAE